jgi:ABC-type uncharacterized transport system involved in gliding motility auxiliary subunit
MKYRKRTITIPLVRVVRIPLLGTHYELADLGKMEETINNHLESLIDINETLGYLADHGTLKLSAGSSADPRLRQETISTFPSLMAQNYTLKGFNLKDGLPGDIACLVIARPTEPFSDYELFQIDQFLMQGKSLALFMDVFEEVMPPQQQNSPRMLNQEPRYVPINSGLEKLLEHYGIRIKKSYALDEECYKQRMPARFGGGERPIYYAPVIKNRFINNELAFMEHIKGLVTLKISPLDLKTERIKENGLKAHRLFASSERSWEMDGRITLNPLTHRPPPSRDEQKSLPLAYLIEGKFPSYFAGKPIPEKKAAGGDNEKKDQSKGTEKEADAELAKIESEAPFRSKGAPGKILVIATAEILKDNMLDEQGETPNTMFIMNTLDFLNNREDIAVLRSKEQRFNPLRDTGQGTKTFVKSFNIAGLPVLVALFGLVVWFNRHSRKKRIQMMFKK